MGNEKRLVRFDWAIKYLLRNKAHFVILEGFLSELLKEDVEIEQILESEGTKYRDDDKTMRVDVLAELGKGEKVIIEVQCVRQWDYLSRMLYGVSKVVVDHLKQGETYGKIPRVISVNIVYFDVGKGDDYIYRGRTEFRGVHKGDRLELGEKEKRMYPETIGEVSEVYPEYYVIKVNQFSNRVVDKFDEWMTFLKDEAIKPTYEAKGLKEASATLNMLKLSEKQRQEYDRYIEGLRDERSLIETHYSDGERAGIEKGERIGIEKGERIGIEKEKRETARKLKGIGLETVQISEITGMTASQIEAL